MNISKLAQTIREQEAKTVKARTARTDALIVEIESAPEVKLLDGQMTRAVAQPLAYRSYDDRVKSWYAIDGKAVTYKA